ncbi:hypothetical protein V8E36_009792 [Tilletia maclaganii]
MLALLLAWLILCLLSAPPAACQAARPIAITSQATYIGSTRTVDAQCMDYFLGLRYARPPLGDLRFQRPQLMGRSNLTILATRYREAGLQGANDDNRSEDCLFLNAIRPAGIAASKRLPVMVYIHGSIGALSNQAAINWNGSRLVAESIKARARIIFVSMNYRLGAFGFLGGSSMLSAARNGHASLNAGMYDTRMALRWVQQHIDAFGGDSGRVTVAGQSAGAFIASNILLSNGGSTDGLYHVLLSPGLHRRPSYSRDLQDPQAYFFRIMLASIGPL